MIKKTMPLKWVASVVLTSSFLVACDDTRIRISHDGGPRHHASHGVTITHTPHNHQVSYDTALGMYVVLGLLNTYWNGTNYYRYHNHGWQTSADYRRWNNVGVRYVPARLYKRHYKKPRRNRIRVLNSY